MNRITAEIPTAPAFGPTPSGEYEATLEAVVAKLEVLHIKLFAHAENHSKHPHGWNPVQEIRAVDTALAGILKGLA